MLGKLLKHEFRATGRIMLPLYLVCIVISATIRISEQFKGSMKLVQSFLTLIYTFVLIAVVLSTFFIMIYRFWKNLLGEEGYLSFTLPVTATQHIVSKVIVTGIWSVLGTVVFFISLFIMIADASTLQMVNKIWDNIVQSFAGVDTTELKILLIVCLVLQVFIQPLYFYAAMAVGQLVNKYRSILSIGAYLFLSMISSVISSVYLVIVGGNGMINEQAVNAEQITSYTSITLFGSIINLVIMGTFCFFITKYILTKKLNLQ